jgi:hypothetical protein
MENNKSTKKEYKLTEKTYEQLRELDDKIKVGQMLNTVLALSPFIELFTSKPSAITIWQISTQDWELFGRTVRSMKDFQLVILRKFCEEAQLFHEMKNNRADVLFWRKMKESFVKK